MAKLKEFSIEEHKFVARQKHTEKYVFPKLESELQPGLELRDYFAAKVLAVACERLSEWEAARMAYSYADAMVEVRNKETEND